MLRSTLVAVPSPTPGQAYGGRLQGRKVAQDQVAESGRSDSADGRSGETFAQRGGPSPLQPSTRERGPRPTCGASAHPTPGARLARLHAGPGRCGPGHVGAREAARAGQAWCRRRRRLQWRPPLCGAAAWPSRAQHYMSRQPAAERPAPSEAAQSRPGPAAAAAAVNTRPRGSPVEGEAGPGPGSPHGGAARRRRRRRRGRAGAVAAWLRCALPPPRVQPPRCTPAPRRSPPRSGCLARAAPSSPPQLQPDHGGREGGRGGSMAVALAVPCLQTDPRAPRPAARPSHGRGEPGRPSAERAPSPLAPAGAAVTAAARPTPPERTRAQREEQLPGRGEAQRRSPPPPPGPRGRRTPTCRARRSPPSRIS